MNKDLQFGQKVKFVLDGLVSTGYVEEFDPTRAFVKLTSIRVEDKWVNVSGITQLFSKVRLLEDTDGGHKKGEFAIFVGNPGRGTMSGYSLKYEDGSEEILTPPFFTKFVEFTGEEVEKL